MIDIRSEHLLRLKELPTYLESRGFGKRVSLRTVKRWIAQGCDGVRLETVVIDRVTLTSLEAIQRWTEAQTTGSQLPTPPFPTSVPPPTDTGPTPEHVASMHLLTEHRMISTELDRVIETLDHPASTRAFASGLLFRAGLRTTEDAQQRGLSELLAIKGLGSRSLAVVRSLWRKLEGPKRSSPRSGDE